MRVPTGTREGGANSIPLCAIRETFAAPERVGTKGIATIAASIRHAHYKQPPNTMHGNSPKREPFDGLRRSIPNVIRQTGQTGAANLRARAEREYLRMETLCKYSGHHQSVPETRRCAFSLAS
jgi:hypothetical protein